MSDFKYYDDMAEQEKEDFINDLVIHYDEITTSDLQGIIMARCFKKDRSLWENMQEEDEILNAIYERVNMGV